MRRLFSLFKKEIKPYHTGYLPAVDGHQIFYQEIGNPDGRAVLSFHGGPGGRANPQGADIFDLKKYRVIMFDQRGCGQSLADDALYNNTMQYIVQDAKRLLDYLNIGDKVILYGCSFGTACALLFACSYRERVDSIVLVSVFLGNTKDVHLFDEVSRLFYPEVNSIFNKIANNEEFVGYFYRCAMSEDVEKQKQALQYFGALEHQIGSLSCSFPPVEEINDKRLNSFRIYLHYVKNKMFLEEDEIFKKIGSLGNIPTYIFHNRLDMVCPVVNAYRLNEKLKESELCIVEDYGHISTKLFKSARDELGARGGGAGGY